LRRRLDRIRSSLELNVVLQTAVDEMAALLGAEACLFFWYFKDIQQIQIVCQTRSASLESFVGHYPLSRCGTIATLVRRGELTADLSTAESAIPWFRRTIQPRSPLGRPWMLLEQPVSMLVPVKGQANVLGFMAVLGPRQDNEAEQEVVQTIVEQLEVAIYQAQLYETIQKQARREQVVNYITNQTRQSLDLRLVLSQTIAQVLDALGSDRCLVHLVNPPDETNRLFQSLPDREQLGHVLRRHYLFEVCRPPFLPSIDDFDTCGPITRWVTEHRQRVVISDVNRDPRIGDHNPEYQVAQIRSALVVPVQTKERLHAILYINQCSHMRYWSRDDQELAQAVADQLAISIQQAYLYTQVQHQAETSRAQAQQLSQTLRDLQYTQAQLIQSEKMSSLGRMVAGVAHEINNPVSFIYGNIPHVEKYVDGLIQLVQLYRDRTPEDEDLRSLMEDIDLDFVLQDLPDTLRSMQSGAERIRQIVLSLRRFARLDEAEWKLANLHESLEAALEVLTTQIPADVSIQKHYGNLPEVECYPQLLNQVFVNLLSNALDALAEAPADRGKTIVITTATFCDRDTQHPWIRIILADNGVGIAPDHQSRVFDPFFTTKDVGRGTGLGLTVSYQTIVHQHRGQISLWSTPQHGTQFTLDLPMHGAIAPAPLG
jgi:two-component system NtrC family sensor kinase